MTTNTTTASQPNAAPSERNAVLEEVARALESKDDGIWANTCGRFVRALKSAAPALPEPAAAQDNALAGEIVDLEMTPISNEGRATTEEEFGYFHDGYCAGFIEARRAAYLLVKAKRAAPSPQPLAEVSAAQAVPFDFHAHLARQAAWSEKTFGPGPRTKGVCDHIRKELVEVEADPLDLKEWIDVVILALDGAWRCGGKPDEIIAGIVAKQTKNEGRVWPDWRSADPDKAIEHDRSHDAQPTDTAREA